MGDLRVYLHRTDLYTGFSRKINKIKILTFPADPPEQAKSPQSTGKSACIYFGQSPAAWGRRRWLKLDAGGGCSGSCLESGATTSGRSSSPVQSGRSGRVCRQPAEVQKQPRCWKSFPERNTLLTPLALNQVGNFTDRLCQGKLLMSEWKHSPGG